MLRTKVQSDMVYIRQIKTLKLPFKFCTMHQMTEDITLLDSRATKNFVDETVWKELNIGQIKLGKALTVHNVDGTKNKQGKIEYYCILKIQYQSRVVRMHFFLTGLREDHFILGYPFLFIFNPDVDWRTARLKGGPVYLKTIGFKRVQ